MITIPLQPIPAQELQIILGGQNCTIRLYWRWWRLYCDLIVNADPVFSGCVCQNIQWINQSPSLLFSGGLMFMDGLGAEAPRWDGLGTRWTLLYFDENEVNDPYAAVEAFVEA